MEDLALDVPYLYRKLRQNILKNSPKKRMEGAIREEPDSFTVASHRRFSKQGQVKLVPTARFGKTFYEELPFSLNSWGKPQKQHSYCNPWGWSSGL